MALELRRLVWFVTNGILPRPPGAASSKRVLDGALFTDARARRARLGSRARLWVENLPMGSHFIEGRARRGPPWRGRGVWGAANRSSFASIGARRPAYSPNKMN